MSADDLTLPSGSVPRDKIQAAVTQLKAEIDGAFTPASVPEVPAAPDAQDVVDALVELGLVTQAEV